MKASKFLDIHLGEFGHWRWTDIRAFFEGVVKEIDSRTVRDKVLGSETPIETSARIKKEGV